MPRCPNERRPGPERQGHFSFFAETKRRQSGISSLRAPWPAAGGGGLLADGGGAAETGGLTARGTEAVGIRSPGASAGLAAGTAALGLAGAAARRCRAGRCASFAGVSAPAVLPCLPFRRLAERGSSAAALWSGAAVAAGSGVGRLRKRARHRRPRRRACRFQPAAGAARSLPARRDFLDFAKSSAPSCRAALRDVARVAEFSEAAGILRSGAVALAPPMARPLVEQAGAAAVGVRVAGAGAPPLPVTR